MVSSTWIRSDERSLSMLMIEMPMVVIIAANISTKKASMRTEESVWRQSKLGQCSMYTASMYTA